MALSLFFSNLALIWAGVALSQMTKATAIPVTFFVGIQLGVNQLNYDFDSKMKLLQLLCISSGVALATAGIKADQGGTSPYLGSLLVFVGVLLDAIKLNLMQTVKGKFSVLALLYYLSPCILAIQLVWAMMHSEFSKLFKYLETNPWPYPPLLMLCNVTLAFGLNFLVVAIVHQLSAITFSVSAIAKDICLVVFSVLFLSETVAPIQWMGYLVAVTGITWYNLSKIKHDEKTKNAHNKLLKDVAEESAEIEEDAEDKGSTTHATDDATTDAGSTNEAITDG